MKGSKGYTTKSPLLTKPVVALEVLDAGLGQAGGAAEAGLDGLLDIQDVSDIAESERELSEIVGIT